jgi:predicted DNA binding protein
MRRLIVESSTKELGRFLGVESSIEKLESFEIISLLREKPEEWAMICRVKMKDPDLTFEELLFDESAKIQHLEKEKDGANIYFVKRKPNALASSVFETGGYFSLPLEVRGGRIRASFLGTLQQIKKLLRIIHKSGIDYRVISITDARFSPTSPLGLLTEKQCKVLTTAFNLGYYDIPKKTTTDEIAKRLHISGPTFVRHREKAERRVLAALLFEA